MEEASIMNGRIYICRRCRHEFEAAERAGVYACPRCGNFDTLKYSPANLLSLLFSGGG